MKKNVMECDGTGSDFGTGRMELRLNWRGTGIGRIRLRIQLRCLLLEWICVEGFGIVVGKISTRIKLFKVEFKVRN